MRTMQIIAAIIVGAGIAAASATVYTNAWSVDLPRNPPAVIDVWHGPQLYGNQRDFICKIDIIPSTRSIVLSNTMPPYPDPDVPL